MNVQDLKEINIKKIEELESIMSEDNIDLKKELLIQKKIQEVLDEDEAIFFKIPRESSLKILSKLVSEEDIRSTFEELISTKEFKSLREDFEL